VALGAAVKHHPLVLLVHQVKVMLVAMAAARLMELAAAEVAQARSEAMLQLLLRVTAVLVAHQASLAQA
jgi:hypothetical protein